MADLTWLSVLIAGLICVMLLVRQFLRQTVLPPGPVGWPFVGNVLQMDPERPHLTWAKWAGYYGDVYTLSSFGKPVVVCSGFGSIREVLVHKSKDFAGRPQLYPLRYITDGGKDVVLCDYNPQWVRRKKVFLTSMRTYMDGPQKFENIMGTIIGDLLAEIHSYEHQPFNIMGSFQLALANTLSLLVFADKFQLGDPDFHRLLELLDQALLVSSPSGWCFLLDACPWLHALPLPYCHLMDSFTDGFARDWIPRQINKRMRNLENGHEESGCVLDGFIKQYEKDMRTGAQHPIDERDLVMLVADVFIAGMTTSIAVLYVMLAVLTAEPDIQEKAQEEVDRVLHGRRPTLQDKENMPYFQALLEEVLRYGVIVPAVAHQAVQDSTISGHEIPKNTDILINIWHLCHNPGFWDDHWAFKPDRFLDDNRKFLPAAHPKRKRVMVFGAGQRMCAGEQLARNRIFLIATSLLQTFTFKSAADDQIPVHDPRTYPLGLAVMPQSYQLRAIPRNS